MKTRTRKKTTSTTKRRTPTRVRRSARTAPMPREYNMDFAPADGDDGHTFKIKRIPTPLYEQVMKKKAREGVSLRARVLKDWQDWVNEDRRPS